MSSYLIVNSQLCVQDQSFRSRTLQGLEEPSSLTAPGFAPCKYGRRQSWTISPSRLWIQNLLPPWVTFELCFLITGGVYLASGDRRAKHLRKMPEIVWRDSIEHLNERKSSEWERSEASVGCFEWILCGWPTKHMEGSFKERKAAGQSVAPCPLWVTHLRFQWFSGEPRF